MAEGNGPRKSPVRRKRLKTDNILLIGVPVVLWLVVSVGLYVEYGDVFPWPERFWKAVGFAGGLVVAMVVFITLGFVLFETLPKWVARQFWTPLQKETHLLNGWGEETVAARAAFMARAELVEDAHHMREALYLDPDSGQYWIVANVETGHSSRDRYFPAGDGGPEAVLRRYAAARQE